MKFRFISKEQRQYRKQMRRREWHPWFAWYPVPIKHDSVYGTTYIFMEPAFRRIMPYASDKFEYRTKIEHFKEQLKNA